MNVNQFSKPMRKMAMDLGIRAARAHKGPLESDGAVATGLACAAEIVEALGVFCEELAADQETTTHAARELIDFTVCEDSAGLGTDPSSIVRAADAATAAELWVKRMDRQNNYPVARGEPITARVWIVGDREETAETFEVAGGSEIVYTATAQ